MKNARVLWITLLFLVVSAVFSTGILAAEGYGEIVDSGECGENLTWTLYGDGLLEISGEGKMRDYKFRSNVAPWYSYGNSITDLKINYGITHIGNYAFYFVGAKTCNLVIPDSVISIGDVAFAFCRITGELKIPDSVISIGESAFDMCNALDETLTLPKNLTSLGEGAFFGCSNLKGSVFIPETVTYIGRGPFNGCEKIEEFIVDPANPSFTSRDGCIYTKDLTEFVHYPCGKAGTLTLPSTVTRIWKGACSGARDKLTGSLNLSEGLIAIEDSAFSYCTGFSGELILPSALCEIGVNAFSGCHFSGELVIPASVTSIGNAAFMGCHQLTAVRFEGFAPVIEQSYNGNKIFDFCSSDLVIYCYSDYASSFTSHEYYDASVGTWCGYKFEIIADVPGDLDGDGTPATPRDAMVLARYIAGWDGYANQINLDAADLDGDGIPATPRDAMVLARHIAGWDGYETIPLK